MVMTCKKAVCSVACQKHVRRMFWAFAKNGLYLKSESYLISQFQSMYLLVMFGNGQKMAFPKNRILVLQPAFRLLPRVFIFASSSDNKHESRCSQAALLWCRNASVALGAFCMCVKVLIFFRKWLLITALFCKSDWFCSHKPPSPCTNTLCACLQDILLLGSEL